MDKIYYYSKSKNVLPGQGVHENINNISDYNELCKINNFRKILSNFHEYPFKYNNLTYNSIEHAFQSEKIRLIDSGEAYKFCLESEHKIAKGDGLIARKNRKLIKLDKKTINHWNNIKFIIMKNITEEKIKQCDIFKQVLLKTNNCELWHIVMRSKSVRNLYLEELRAKYKLYQK